MTSTSRASYLPVRIATLAGSIRNGSLNAQLARLATDTARELGAEGVFIDLARYPLPLYNADLEQSQGIPAKAVEVAEQILAADGLVIASPEYNGAYSAQLKNTIDWVTRVEYRAWARPTALMSATPGRSGGRRGLDILRSTLKNMGVPLVGAQLALAQAPMRILEGRLLETRDRMQMELVVDELIASVLERAA